jgi:hypothetical protein
MIHFSLFSVVLIIAIFGSQSPEDWTRADEATVRLRPSKIPVLPAEVREELERRGCTVPQPFTGRSPQNAVTGRFTSAIRIDWAVLCSRARASSILVFRGGSAKEVVEIAKAPDRHYLQGVGGGSIGFSRALGVASPQFIREHYETYGGPKPPLLGHDGIDDRFVGKASGVWYWHRGRWLRLQGAD